MNRLSDNYYHRKCYLERNQVPTLSIIKNKMSEPLAKVYFNSMSKKVKVFTDPMPSTKPIEWYMPPEQMLAGRAVLKPIVKQHFAKLNATGLWNLGEKLKNDHYHCMLTEMQETLKHNDDVWRKTIDAYNRKHSADRVRHEAGNNTKKLLVNLESFESLYMSSITKLEEAIKTAAVNEIERIRSEVYQHMRLRLSDLVKSQALKMQNDYEIKLNKKKAEFKKLFVTKVENIRSDIAKQIHDSNIDKHLAVEKLRHFLQCQNLACQVYVALKEKEACEKEMEQSKHQHKKAVKSLQEDIRMKEMKIKLEMEQQKKRKEFNDIWKTKVCHVVKMFQSLVEYCLCQLPQHAEFFLNMEKLMLLQLSEAYDAPDVENNILEIIEPEKTFDAPEPRPHPFYLFCDIGYKPDIDQNRCPKHATSSASHLPVIVIDRRCIYSSCDNCKMATKKVAECVHGNKREDIEDYDEYELKVPVKYTSLMQLLELKLESSLMQVLQTELPNSRDLPINCSYCKIPFCYCTEKHLSKTSIKQTKKDEQNTPLKSHMYNMTNATELQMRREPKWKSYSEYVTTKRCKCSRTAQKDLLVHLPPYMKSMSPYVPPELSNYETCDVNTLRRLVNRANKICTPVKNENLPKEMTKDAFTQYSDHAFETLCTCLSDDSLSKFFQALMKDVNPCQISDDDSLKKLDVTTLPSPLTRTANSFATARARSLHRLLYDYPSLTELFTKQNCD